MTEKQANTAKYAWLMKSEPSEVSVDDVLAKPNSTVGWFGVRNYQARNFMRDDCKCGDPVLFYHSSCKQPGIVGIGEIASDPYPDPTQFDRSSQYFDPKSKEESPRWIQVDVKVNKKIDPISLDDLRSIPECQNMIVLKKGNRLSITPVTKEEYEAITTKITKVQKEEDH